MLQGKEWNQFFNNISNKSDLLRLLNIYLRKEDVRSTFRVPVIVNDDSKTWRLTSDDASQIFGCNHEEADTRMVLHACLQDTNVNVLILLVYAFTIHNPSKEWYMKIDSDTYIRIRAIVDYFGVNVCSKLPHLHAVTGCDTSSFLHGVGKVEVVKNVFRDYQQLQNLQHFGETISTSEEMFENVSKFIQMTCYSGTVNESLVETRVRIYKKMKVKSSLTLPPDPQSMKQHILRAQFQLFEWLRFDEKLQEERSFENSGWIWDVENQTCTPNWFEGDFLFHYPEGIP